MLRAVLVKQSPFLLRNLVSPLVAPARPIGGWDPRSPSTATLAAWFDLSCIATLFTDTAGTVPVTADGDLVACMKDKSGNGNHATQSTSASRPIYRSGGYLDFDGARYLTTGAIQLTGSGQHSAGAAVYFNAVASYQNVLDADNGGSIRESQFLRCNPSGQLETIAFNTTPAAFTDTGPSIAATTGTVLSEITTATTTEAFVNGVGSGGSTATSGSPAAVASVLTIGAFASGNSQFLTGRFYGSANYQGALSASDHAQLVTFLTAKLPTATTYNDNLSESASAADSAAAAQTFVNALTENTTPGDSYVAALVMAGSLNETVAAATALTTAQVFASAATESAVAADSIDPAGSTFGVPLSESESASATDALGVGLVIPASVGESAAAADSVTSSQAFASALGESAAATDDYAGGNVIGGSLNETAAATDAGTVAVTFNPTLAESAAAADSAASQAAMVNALGESAGAIDQAAATQVFNEALGESAAAADSVSPGAVYNEAVSENLTALASLGVGLVLPVAVAESAAAAEATSATADLAAALDEAAIANDNVVGTVTSIWPPGPVDPARIGLVDRQDGTVAIAASSRSEAVAAIRRNGSVAAAARIGKVSRVGRVG